MRKSDELWQIIVKARGQAPRAVIVEYAKAVIAEAKAIPLEQLVKNDPAGDMSEGEVVASKLITGLGQQAWLEDDDELSRVFELAGQLDVRVEGPQLWSELFEAVDNL